MLRIVIFFERSRCARLREVPSLAANMLALPKWVAARPLSTTPGENRDKSGEWHTTHLKKPTCITDSTWKETKKNTNFPKPESFLLGALTMKKVPKNTLQRLTRRLDTQPRNWKTERLPSTPCLIRVTGHRRHYRLCHGPLERGAVTTKTQFSACQSCHSGRLGHLRVDDFHMD